VNREPATLIVLAGGEAKRLGFPKHRLTVDGTPVLTHLHARLGPLFAKTIVVGRDLDGLPPGVRATEDRYLVRSPLVGIHAGLAASRTDLAFVTACDMPHVEPALVEYLLAQAEGVDAVVPVVRGYYEPLCAVYRRTCIAPVEDLIERGVLKVSALYDLVRVHEVDEPDVHAHDPDRRSFTNLNLLADTALSVPRPSRVSFERGNPERFDMDQGGTP
jgi:molybdopterin-guanine dinucleotide biosynthesis protein A